MPNKAVVEEHPVENTMDVPKTWVTLIQTVGFPVVACLAVCWFANNAIEYERERMTPALEACSKSIETQVQQARTTDETLKRVNDTLIRLESRK